MSIFYAWPLFQSEPCNAVEGISGGGAQRNKSSLYRANAECPRTGKLRCSLQPCHRASPNLLALVCPMQRDFKFQLVCCMPHVSVRCTQCRYDGMSCTGLHEAALIRLDTDTKIRSPDAPSTYIVFPRTQMPPHTKKTQLNTAHKALARRRTKCKQTRAAL